MAAPNKVSEHGKSETPFKNEQIGSKSSDLIDHSKNLKKRKKSVKSSPMSEVKIKKKLNVGRSVELSSGVREFKKVDAGV